MRFKLMDNNTFLVEFAPEEGEIAINFLKGLTAPNPEQEMLLEELIMLLGGIVNGPDRSLLLQ